MRRPAHSGREAGSLKVALLLVAFALIAPAASADVVPHECIGILVAYTCAGEFYAGDGCAAGTDYDYGYTGARVRAAGPVEPIVSLESSCNPSGGSGDAFRLEAWVVIVSWWSAKNAEGAREYGALGANVPAASFLWYGSTCSAYVYPVGVVACPVSPGNSPDAPSGGGQLLP